MLTPFTDDIWFSHYEARSAGMRFKARTTVAKLCDGSVWVHSPGPIDDALGEAIAAVGPVRHLVAPNCFHYLFAARARERYPEATLWAPEALRRKRPKLPIDAVLTDEAAFGEDFDQVLIEVGPKMAEVDFLHRATGTLVTTDLVFNMDHVDHWWTRQMLTMARAYPGVRQSRLWRFVTKDRDAAREGVERLLALPFQRVVVAHGEPLEGPDCADTLRNALYWMRGVPEPA